MAIILNKEPITTSRLILKEISDSDITRLISLLKNEEISKTFIIPTLSTKEKEISLATKIINTSKEKELNRLCYGIYYNSILIGMINDVGINDKELEIGYFIDPAYQNRGFATEAFIALLSSLKQMGFKKVAAGFFEGNLASQKVMIKCGLRKLDIEDEINYRNKDIKVIYYGIIL